MELYNEDCYGILRTIPDNSVDAIITDPPYDFDMVELRKFDSEFCRIAPLRIIFCPPENQWQIFPPADQYLFWVKPISTKNTSKNYSRFVEMIQVFGKNEWNTDRHWSQYTNVFTDLVESKLHPFQKPLSLMTRLVLNHTKKGDTILDPFMGSGTTGVASLQHGRNFIGIEIDKENFDLAKERLDEVCGKQEPLS